MTPSSPNRLLRVGRFERRIIFAISIVAFVPLVAAAVFGWLSYHELYRVGVNERVRDELARNLEHQAEHLALLRAHDETLADLWARDPAIDALAASPEALGRHLAELAAPAAATAPGEPPDGRVVGLSVDALDGAGPAIDWRSPSWSGDLATTSLVRRTGGGRALRVTFAVPTELENDHASTRGTLLVYETLEADGVGVTTRYTLGYLVLLLSVIVVAMAVAILLSRRVTRRILLLADATDRVGAGDLTAEVPTDERDEVGELTRAFNEMVRDLRSSRDRVEYLERVGAWQEIAKRLAHEIKNPLTPIQLVVQQLHQAYRGDDARFKKTLDDAREMVDEEVATLRRLVSEFSEFARLPEPELSANDLVAVTREAVRTLDPSALRAVASDRQAPRLSTELDAQPVPVKVDAQLLRRCLDNLVRNAVQAVDAHGGESVIVACRREGDEALLEVRDDGPGVPAEARERVFQPYFTTKEFGTGLGLAIVKKAVLEHGGSIECVAAPEGGACFRIRLPLRGTSDKDTA